MEIRKATKNDIGELTSLIEQLGYPTTIEQMKIRFNHIESSPDYHTLVASNNGRAIGMVGMVKGFYYEMDGFYVRIVAFVVDSSHRSKGIGKKLLEEAENWARKIGATGIVLNSGNRPERMMAYQFYKRMGFVEKSTGFAKSLI